MKSLTPWIHISNFSQDYSTLVSSHHSNHFFLFKFWRFPNSIWKFALKNTLNSQLSIYSRPPCVNMTFFSESHRKCSPAWNLRKLFSQSINFEQILMRNGCTNLAKLSPPKCSKSPITFKQKSMSFSKGNLLDVFERKFLWKIQSESHLIFLKLALIWKS